MKPFLLKLPLQRKESELHTDVCEVDRIVELSEQEYRAFRQNLLADYDFLREYNQASASAPAEGVRPGVLVLGEGFDDGVFVCTEGYDYARYSACVPDARQWLLLEQYPSLRSYGKDMADLADSCIRKALTPGLREYEFAMEEVRKHSNSYYAFNDSLLMDMLCDRPEIASLDVEDTGIVLTLNPDYLPQPNPALHSITREDFKVACARHLLGIYGAGGELADFSNCVFERTNFSGMELNSAVFDGAVFRNCNLSDASLCFASFKGCVFVGCSFQAWTAEEAVFQEAVFDHCNLNNAMMTHSDFTNAVLQDCTVEHASIQNCLTQNMRMEDVGIGSLKMDGITEDAAQWFGEADQSLSMEEIQ